MIKFRTYNQEHEASLHLALLKEHNINCFIQVADAGGLMPHLALTSGAYSIYVDENDFEKAKALID